MAELYHLNQIVCSKKAVDLGGAISKQLEVHDLLNSLLLYSLTIIIGVCLIFDEQT